VIKLPNNLNNVDKKRRGKTTQKELLGHRKKVTEYITTLVCL